MSRAVQIPVTPATAELVARAAAAADQSLSDWLRVAIVAGYQSDPPALERVAVTAYLAVRLPEPVRGQAELAAAHCAVPLATWLRWAVGRALPRG